MSDKNKADVKEKVKSETDSITDIIINNNKHMFHKNIENFFLVDYENVKLDGLIGIENRKKTDSICILYSKNADKMSFDLHAVLNNTKAVISTQRVRVGYKNALDFQLASFLGYTISQSRENCKKKASYYIVTKDNGFNCLIDYWKKQGYDVYIVKNLMTQDEIQDELEYKVRKLLDDEDDIKFAVECIKNCNTKTEVNAAMMKKYSDGKKVSQVYQAIKPLIINKL